MTTTTKSNAFAMIGLLLVTPTFYFILISVLKYVFGVPYLFDSAGPILEQYGISEGLGWNINLLILFGPVLALLMNLTSILNVHFENSKDNFDCRLTIYKKTWNLAVVFFSALVLGTLFLYALGENCNC